VGAGAGLIAGWEAVHRWPWILGVFLLLAVLPWTVLAMLPIQRRLDETRTTSADPEARRLVERWGRLHLGRLALGLGALALFLEGVLQR